MKGTRSALVFATFLCVSLAAHAVFAQQPAGKAQLPQNVKEEKLTSALMARDLKYRVVLPNGYSDSKSSAIRYPVIYLLHGLGGHFDNWTDRSKVAEYAAAFPVIIVTPEGDNGWYTDSAAKPNDKYESYIIQELIPEIDKKYRTAPDRGHRAIGGLSMGGFGALKFGLKYPETFSLAGSFSGALFASSYRTPDDLPPGNIRTSLIEVFGAPDSVTKKANDLFAFIRDATPEKVKSMPYLYLACGTEDFLFQNNRDFIALIVEKKVPHEYRQLPGVHDWKFWDDQIQEFLKLANKRLNS